MGIRKKIAKAATAAANKPLTKLFSNHYTASGRLTARGAVAKAKKFVKKNPGKTAAAAGIGAAGTGIGGYYAYRKARTSGKK